MPKSLKELLLDSANNAETDKKVARISANIIAKIDGTLTPEQVAYVQASVRKELKGETSQSYECPHCGGVIDGWRPSEESSSVDNDDDSNEQDDDDEIDNRRGSRVSALAKDLLKAAKQNH